ncbi:MAG TPA: Gfo/Idh/MocA family oxidoreductase [Phycisphaerae bacterium]|nr:Gfo/Idh/MocA family oxidoreductase [Phycisphaerae bacterium]
MRVAVSAWWPLRRISDVYFEQPRSLRRIWNYLCEVGVRTLLRKVRSRRAESLRDRRVLAVGIGRVLEAGEAAHQEAGAPVVFVAPCHPECVERVVLPAECVALAAPGLSERFHCEGAIHWLSESAPNATDEWHTVAGWSEFSGQDISKAIAGLLQWAQAELRRIDPGKAVRLPLDRPTPVQERLITSADGSDSLSAVVFGLGNYAKQWIMPYLSGRIRLRCVHEIDPTQIGRLDGTSVSYDTCDRLRDDERYDVYFIAGYHHTHAPLAVAALRRGGRVVVEKPLVTTSQQLTQLLDVLHDCPGLYFACFQKRYNPLWQMARSDLGVHEGDPVHYHCTVFEVPLPRRHWYTWPNSGSRLISNGCHWLDHFLFMNGFCEPATCDLWRGGNGDLHVSVELSNGAVFGMFLTDEGSPRIGLQDHVELRAKGKTVTVDNAGQYRAEDATRVLRRKRINKTIAHKRMYRTICSTILNGGQGDSIESVQRSCELVLQLENMYQNL